MPYLPSLFTDPELLNKFVDITKPHIKQAQIQPAQVTPTTVDPNMIKAVATKMINNLNTATSLNVDKTGAPLYMRDLQSLDQFLSFLYIGQVKYAGHPIVNDQYVKLAPVDQAHYAPYTWAEVGTHVTPVVGVYKDGLIAYLKMMQQKATNDPQGQLFTTLIEKLIESANTTLKITLDHEAPKETDVSTTQPTGEGAQQTGSYQTESEWETQPRWRQSSHDHY